MVDKTVDKWLQEAMDAGELDQHPSNQCRVCRDPVIMGLVNKMLACGFRASDILDTVKAHNLKLKRAGKPQITWQSIHNHRDRHFDIQAPAYAMYRKVQEQRARDAGQDWREGVGTVLNALSYLETVGIKGYETLIDPMTVVDYNDGTKAMVKLYELARDDEDAYERHTMLAEMSRLIEVVREFVPADQWPALQARLRGEQTAAVESQPVESVRVVSIDDTPDLEGN